LLNRAWLLLGAWLTRLLKLSARDTTAAAGGASQAGAGPALRISGALQKPPAVEIVACSQVAAEEVGEWAPSMGGGGAQQADEEKEGGEACHDVGPFSCGEEWEYLGREGRPCVKMAPHKMMTPPRRQLKK
jgi:hypothetical protein